MHLGSLCSARILERFDTPLNYLWLGHWMNAHGFQVAEYWTTREELFHDLARQVGRKKVLYLEFGVAHGASLRYWSQLLTNPESSLDGFDTFEGLPLDWKAGIVKGAFSNQGQLPQIADERVRFFKGLFEHTMPGYSIPDHEVLIVNIDCDLYSSACYVLNQLGPHLAPGDFIYFDEFNDRGNELRAFNDFLSLNKSRFRLAGATPVYRHVLFECLDNLGR
jgi:hypothetical protein